MTESLSVSMSYSRWFARGELNRSRLACVLPLLARSPSRVLHDLHLKAVIRREGGLMYSYTAREVLLRQRRIVLGSYSYGKLADLCLFPVDTVVGRYVSIGSGVRAFQANHPTGSLSMHPLFFRSDIGIAEEEAIERGQLTIGHDAWLGANSIICPRCHSIGNGAVVGAGAVVTKDVPDYAVVVGNPAKVIKMRFRDSVIAKLLQTEWWWLAFDQLESFRNELTSPLDDDRCEDLLSRLTGLKLERVGT